MAESKDEVQGVADLLAKTKVEQVNVVSFKGKSFKLNSADDGKLVLFVSLLNDPYNSPCFDFMARKVTRPQAVEDIIP